MWSRCGEVALRAVRRQGKPLGSVTLDQQVGFKVPSFPTPRTTAHCYVEAVPYRCPSQVCPSQAGLEHAGAVFAMTI
jgi:hypothetical protein